MSLALDLSIGNNRRNRNGRGASTPSIPGWVISRPSFPNLAGFDSTTLFLQSDGTGVKGTYDGLTATGTINLSAPIDKTRPFTFGTLLEWNGDADRTAVRLVSADDDSYLSMSFSVDAGDLRVETGVHGFFLLLSGLVSGDKFWLGVSWDVTGNATIWAVPLSGHTGYHNPADYLGPVHKDYRVPVIKDYTAGAAGHGVMLQNVTKIVVYAASITTRVLSLFARNGSFALGDLDRIEPPILLNPVVANDVTPAIRVPSYTPSGPRDLILAFHGAGSSEDTGHVEGSADDGAAIAHLVENGYIVARMRGTDDFSGTTYTGPKASNWGAPGPITTWWKPFVNLIKAKFPIRNVYLLGLSMGLENALRYHAMFGGIKAIVGISGVCNLSYAYTSEGFKASIDAAHLSDDVSDIAAYDPTLTPSLFNLPIALWHGDSDATIAKVHHMDAFATAVNAVHPGKVVTHSVVGGDHLSASCFDGPAILAFLQAHV